MSDRNQDGGPHLGPPGRLLCAMSDRYDAIYCVPAAARARVCLPRCGCVEGGGVVTRSPGGKNLVTAGHQRRVRERESSSSVRSFRSSTALGSFYLDQFLLFLLQSVPISPAAVSYSLPVALSSSRCEIPVDTGVRIGKYGKKERRLSCVKAEASRGRSSLGPRAGNSGDPAVSPRSKSVQS